MSNTGWPTQPGVAPPEGFTSEMLQRSHPAYPGHPDHEAWLESVDAELAVAVHEFHGFETPDEATVGEWDASTVGAGMPVDPGPTPEEIAEAERAEAERVAAEQEKADAEARAAADAEAAAETIPAEVIEDSENQAGGHPATEEPLVTPEVRQKPTETKATKATPTKKAAAKRGARRGR